MIGERILVESFEYWLELVHDIRARLEKRMNAF